MASVNVTSAYVGEVAETLLALTKLGNEAVEKGSVFVVPGVSEALFIPRLNAADDQLQDRQETPDAPSDSFTYDERPLTPLDMMFFDLENPRNFESAWRPFQPTGPLVSVTNNPTITSAILMETVKTVGKQLGKLIWAGDLSAGGGSPLRFFDGFVTIAIADAGTIQVTPAGVITETNIISILEDVEAAIPASIWQDPSVIFHLSTTDYRLYLAAARALDFKGTNIVDAGESRFAGRQIRFYTDFPKDHIMVAKATASNDSNLWAGVWVDGDEENVKVERYRPESELFIIKVLFKYAVQFGITEEVVLYQPI